MKLIVGPFRDSQTRPVKLVTVEQLPSISFRALRRTDWLPLQRVRSSTTTQSSLIPSNPHLHAVCSHNRFSHSNSSSSRKFNRLKVREPIKPRGPKKGVRSFAGEVSSAFSLQSFGFLCEPGLPHNPFSWESIHRVFLSRLRPLVQIASQHR